MYRLYVYMCILYVHIIHIVYTCIYIYIYIYVTIQTINHRTNNMIHIYMYVYVCIYINVYIFIYESTQHTQIKRWIAHSINQYIYMCVCMPYICTYLYISIYIYICIYIYASTYTYTYTSTVCASIIPPRPLAAHRPELGLFGDL